MPSGAVRIPFQRPLHKAIVDALCSRVRLSDRQMREKQIEWQDAERSFQAYIPEREIDRKRRSERKSGGMPHYTTLVFPYAYAQLMTAHTYLTSVFLSRNPVLQHIGRHGEADINVQAVDAIIDYQVQVGGLMVPLYTWLLDPGKYGFGVLWLYWDREVSVISQVVEERLEVLGQPVGGAREVRKYQEIVGYEGNKAFNVRPWDFITDPRVALSDVQRGEFTGRRLKVGWNTIRRGEAQGKYFNIDELRKILKGSAYPGSLFSNVDDNDESIEQIQKPSDENLMGSDEIKEMGFVRLVELCVELIPKEWKLGSSTYPEKWVFTLAEDKILIGAQPLGAYHNKFPVAIISAEPEAYGFMPTGMLERSKPLNDVIDWLVNTHFYNVRSVLNNQLVYDPSRVVEADVMSREPGKRIRLRPEAYGTDTRTVVHQIPVGDATRNHLSDVQFVNEMASRITGVTDNIMGMLSPRGRKTATEVRTSSSFGVNRLKTLAEFMSAQGWAPLDMMLVQNTQQYMTQAQKYRIAGDTMTRSEPFVEVSPEAIQGFYDFIPVDGALPVDRFAMAQAWGQLFAQMRQFPQLMMGYDLKGIFEMVAQMAGMKSLKQFRIQNAPTSVVEAGAAAGNLIALGEQTYGRGAGNVGANSGGPPSGGTGAAGDVPLPPQLPGLGDVA